MSKEKKTCNIMYGVMAEPISLQLKEQGFNLDEKSMDYFDRIKEAINTLTFNGLTTDSQRQQLLQRANKYIIKQVQDWYYEQVQK